MKLKMSVLLFLVLLTGFSLAQTNPFVPDFKISEDNYKASFVQKNPKLFTNGTKGFIVAWEDYRDGSLGYYAQRYDSLGNKKGGNFKIASNYDLCFGTNDWFINIKEEHESSDFGGGSIGYYATIYDNNNNVVKDDIFLDFVSIPFCGLGDFHFNTKVCKASNGYFAGVLDDSHLDLFGIDYSGNITYKYSFPDSVHIVNFDIVTNKDIRLVTYLTTKSSGLTIGDTCKLTAKIMNDDTLIAQNDFIIKTSFVNKNDKDYQQLKNIALADSSFMILDFLSDSLKLSYRKYNKKGERLTGDSVFQLTDKNPQSYYIGKFEVLDRTNGKHAVYIEINSDSSLGYDFILTFDKFGNLENVSSYKSTNDIIQGQPFFISEEEYFTSHGSVDDIFLMKNNKAGVIDSVKINDDILGGNDIKPEITRINNSKYLITWNNENEIFGRVVSNNGIPEGEQVRLESKTTIFLNNKYISYWEKKINLEDRIAGFTIYDASWNEIKKDTLQHGKYNLDYDLKKLTDYYFAVIQKTTNNKVKLLIYNSLGNLLNELVLTDDINVKPFKIFRNDNHSFWVKWGGNLQLFDLSLNPVTEKYSNKATEYLGGNKFLYLHDNPSYMSDNLWATLLNEKGEELSEQFFIKNLTVGDYYDNKCKIVPITPSKFLVIFSWADWQDNYKVGTYFRVYHNTGGTEQKKKIHEDDVLNATDVSALADNHQILFAWADYRDGNRGYDIYGNIYNIDDITKVNNRSKNTSIRKFYLSQNYPNPFNPATQIKYTISTPLSRPPLSKGRDGEGLFVTLKVYNILGKEISTLVNKKQKPGTYQITFDATNLPSGVYYYHLTCGSYSETKKMILMK